MTSCSCYPCKYLIYSLSCISGLQWLLHFHSPLVRSWGKKSPANFSTCFSLSLKILNETVCDFLWNTEILCHLLFPWQKPTVSPYSFISGSETQFWSVTILCFFSRQTVSKTFRNKMFTFPALHICSKLLFFFLFWFNLTIYFADLVMILVFISAPMCLSWSVLIDLLPTGDAPHTCSLSYIISYYQCWLALFFWPQDKERWHEKWDPSAVRVTLSQNRVQKKKR